MVAPAVWQPPRGQGLLPHMRGVGARIKPWSRNMRPVALAVIALLTFSGNRHGHAGVGRNPQFSLALDSIHRQESAL